MVSSSEIYSCTASVYRDYQQRGYTGTVPTLQDFRAELLKQDEPEAKEIALAIELFTHGSLNTFAKPTNVDTHSRLICYDILDLGKHPPLSWADSAKDLPTALGADRPEPGDLSAGFSTGTV